MTQKEAQNIHCTVGELVILSNGVYSDYDHYGVYMVKVDLTGEVLTSLFEECAKTLEGSLPYSFDTHGRFADFLVEKGYLQRLTYKELYLGAYGDFEPEISNEVTVPNNSTFELLANYVSPYAITAMIRDIDRLKRILDAPP